jgi:predicted ATPase
LEANPIVKERVRDWFVASAKLSSEVEFKSNRDRGQMEILFTEATTGLEIDISRLGFGYSQILPIVVAAFSDMNMLIFEAPEIHLNPSLHGALADLFIEGANDGKQVLVETHSEHVIYRIQRRVAEGIIAPEDVAIYYVSRGQEGSVANRLTLTKEGEIPDWPAGFFEAEMEDIYERVLALRNPIK